MPSPVVVAAVETVRVAAETLTDVVLGDQVTVWLLLPGVNVVLAEAALAPTALTART